MTTRGGASVLAFLLLAAACGGGTADTTSATTTTAPSVTTTTATATTTTTEATNQGPLDWFVGVAVEDPLLDSGYHEMVPAADGDYVVSVDSVTGSNPEVDRLALGFVDPAPVTTGIGEDQVLVVVWVDNWSGDIAPSGMTLYTSGIEGWSATATIDTADVLTFLETTGDYNASNPDGPPVVVTEVTQFDWTGTAHFIAVVSVYDLLIPDATFAYQGEIECTLTPRWIASCSPTTGVPARRHRRGRRGLQEDLIHLDYMGSASGSMTPTPRTRCATSSVTIG
jgi:hypothetical protein